MEAVSLPESLSDHPAGVRVNTVDRRPAPSPIPRFAPCSSLFHCHENHRVAVVLTGRGVLRSEDERAIHLRPGDALTLNPGWAHRVEPQANLTMLGFEFFPGNLLNPDEFHILQGAFVGNPVLHCRPGGSMEMVHLLHRLEAEQQHPQRASSAALRACTLSLLVELYRLRGRGDSRTRAALEAERRLRDVRAAIEASLSEPLRVGDLAEAAHLSVRQFTALFKRAHGVTPLQYVTGLRIAHAQRLLRESNLGIQEIARSVGYENLSHFYRLFEHYAGMPPGRYRRGSD